MSIANVAQASPRRELSDWFHLVENRHQVGGSLQRLATVEDVLWQGDMTTAIQQCHG